jgi:hypothetical protein
MSEQKNSVVSKGSCLCGEVTYEVSGHIGIFQYCHCSRCRKFTGSAHCANMFVRPEHFKWISGESLLGRYEPSDTKHFATTFCTQCGSSLPWLEKTQRTVIIPAGTLDTEPPLLPQQSVFYASKADWYVSPKDLPKHDELPVK